MRFGFFSVTFNASIRKCGVTIHLLPYPLHFCPTILIKRFIVSIFFIHVRAENVLDAKQNLVFFPPLHFFNREWGVCHNMKILQKSYKNELLKHKVYKNNATYHQVNNTDETEKNVFRLVRGKQGHITHPGHPKVIQWEVGEPAGK